MKEIAVVNEVSRQENGQFRLVLSISDISEEEANAIQKIGVGEDFLESVMEVLLKSRGVEFYVDD